MAIRTHDRSAGWISEDVQASQVELHRWLRRHTRDKMGLKHWKAVKVALLSFALIGFAGYAVANGADPGPVFWVLAATVAVLNGVEVSEFLAVWTALQDADQDEADE